MEDHEIRALPTSIDASAASIARYLEAATVKQWQRPPVRHADKAGGGAPSLVSNPTADIALNAGRLKLRATVLAVGRELATIDARLVSLRQRLAGALDEYHS